ncbi:DUF3347 domain-containing protein [Flavisolibacter sp. BT320]|nr:DUF3347 domain-containing protein [Flavisolibacter longurius]
MRNLILLFLLAGAGIIAWVVLSKPEKKEPTEKAEAIAVSKHSTVFNESIAAVLNEYNTIAENFVNWDSAASKTAAASLITKLESLQLEELKKDSAAIFETAEMFITNAKGDAQTIASENGIRTQREAFNSMTDNLYQFLNTVNYDGQTIYLQECPMAFDDTKSAFWLSQKDEIRNPYLGLHHPHYGKGMLACGENKTKIEN